MADRYIFQGQNITCLVGEENIAELVFDHSSASVNKFDTKTLGELEQAVQALKQARSIEGLLISSKKSVFIVGADITEFGGYFTSSDETMREWLGRTHATFAAIEDLPYPSVTAINGVCLGGGYELALTTGFRVASTSAQVGLPETKLGIYPGWGGTIRLPRLIGVDNAIEWIAGGKAYAAEEALQVGAVDAVVEPSALRATCLGMLKQARKGQLDWEKRQREKCIPLAFGSPYEATMAFASAKAVVGAKAGSHYPAPMAAIAAIEACADKDRAQSQPIEISGFIKLAKSSVADALISIFLSEQYTKKKSTDLSKKAGATQLGTLGVVGAGIMGGGIAYQAASCGVPTIMKDINQAALTAGLQEAGKLFVGQVERKKARVADVAHGMSLITSTLGYQDFSRVGVVIEAVVENMEVKQKVFRDLEEQVASDCIIASNTSTISISRLASELKRPENFCGIHFFNPVHRMPLVEIIRGEKTSEQTLARAVSLALQLGKKPIVVNDCPGFLVNRILFPYFFGFMQLVADGVEFSRIDKVMEKYGWPMGPAWLIDVIGIDTAVHAAKVMAAGFPERMGFGAQSAMTVLQQAGRLGQKSGAGFYRYEKDKNGKVVKQLDPQVLNHLRPVVKGQEQVSDSDIVNRMMVPMINEAMRCLEEQIVATPMELDLAIIYGLGYPPFRGGLLKSVDQLGVAQFCAIANELRRFGPCYAVPAIAEEMAQRGARFYR